jgi:hypothetical protein
MPRLIGNASRFPSCTAVDRKACNASVTISWSSAPATALLIRATGLSGGLKMKNVIEGWSKTDYLEQIKDVINSIGSSNNNRTKLANELELYNK